MGSWRSLLLIFAMAALVIGVKQTHNAAGVSLANAKAQSAQFEKKRARFECDSAEKICTAELYDYRQLYNTDAPDCSQWLWGYPDFNSCYEAHERERNEFRSEKIRNGLRDFKIAHPDRLVENWRLKEEWLDSSFIVQCYYYLEIKYQPYDNPILSSRQ